MTNSSAVDDEIYSCLDLDNPKSFFLFAGAGSGKTRTLVEVLKRFRKNNIDRLKVNAQKVAIITYTNAASDEIKRRLDFDTTFNVSTIHSFAWELIKSHQNDIREVLRLKLPQEISDLQEKQKKGRAGSKAAEDRPREIAIKQKRLELLDNIKKFTYAPNGQNVGQDSLQHSEVISLTAELLLTRQLLQRILIQKFPVLLVDESQDTNKEFIDVLFHIQGLYKKQFTLGLFGDVMQRIYMDGKEDLGYAPFLEDWITPKKIYNHRCPQRIVNLINKIRSVVDDNIQKPIKPEDGFVRLFIVSRDSQCDKVKLENHICNTMADITGDEQWRDPLKGSKTLILEHHMAATRGGFSKFFIPLYTVDKIETGLLDGSNAGISFFTEKILLLINSIETSNQFAVARVMNKFSPLLAKELLKLSSTPKNELAKAKSAVESLYSLWSNGADPTLLAIIKEVRKSCLFNLPDIFTVIADRQKVYEEHDEGLDSNPVIDAWDKALLSRFSEFRAYVDYISESSRYGTHQGIKGLEFPRVTVILDDEEARGFSFSYEKLFGAKPATRTDIENQNNGKETSIDRTRRLFYVTCSRAEQSLAIIAYTNSPTVVKEKVLGEGWFDENEIIMFE